MPDGVNKQRENDRLKVMRGDIQNEQEENANHDQAGERDEAGAPHFSGATTANQRGAMRGAHRETMEQAHPPKETHLFTTGTVPKTAFA